MKYLIKEAYRKMTLKEAIEEKNGKKKGVLSKDIVEFLFKKPDPSDEDVHNWAESNSYDIDKVKAEMYKLASKYANFLKEGMSVKKGITKSDVESKELSMGIKVEKEHTSDSEIAERIALDHLAEMDNYYSELKKMEKSAPSKKTKDVDEEEPELEMEDTEK